VAKFTLGRVIEDTLSTWGNLLGKLTFSDNFLGYEWTGEIAAGEEKRITHSLEVIPTRFLVLESKQTNLLAGGFTRNTREFFYLKNRGTTATFTGKVLILP